MRCKLVCEGGVSRAPKLHFCNIGVKLQNLLHGCRAARFDQPTHLVTILRCGRREDHQPEAAEHFGWFTHLASVDLPCSSAWTRETPGWEPAGVGLIADVDNAYDFEG